jgi:hypothetical protein
MGAASHREHRGQVGEKTMQLQGTTENALSEGAGENSYWLVRDDSGPNVEVDPTAIFAGLQGELDRISVIHDTSCIFVMSLDTERAEEVMDELCGRIATRLRSYDAVYRFAPDKLLIMLPHIERKDAVSVVRRLRKRIMTEPFALADGEKARLTASFGGTMLDSQTPLHEHMDRTSEAHDWALKGMGDSICMWTPRF